jgi:DNA-directed RNA polymerase subunit RPC12/RpoP
MAPRLEKDLPKRCPHCGGGLRTTDSRASSVAEVICRRRVACQSCGSRFTTHEVIVSDMQSVSATLAIVAAHDRAQDAVAMIISHLDPEEIKMARMALVRSKPRIE